MSYKKGQKLLVVDPKNILKTKEVSFIKECSSTLFAASDMHLYTYDSILESIDDTLNDIDKMFTLAIKNYPDAKYDILVLYDSYKNGGDMSVIIEDFKDIVSEYDTIVFNSEGLPDVYNSDDILLASYIEQVMYM